jgi:hypothetical protein
VYSDANATRFLELMQWCVPPRRTLLPNALAMNSVLGLLGIKDCSSAIKNCVFGLELGALREAIDESFLWSLSERR